MKLKPPAPYQFSRLINKWCQKPPALVGIEIFVATCLVIYYFLLVLPMAEEVRHYGNDTQSLGYFTALSHHPTQPPDFAKEYPDVQTRLPGEIITGKLTDWVWNDVVINDHHYVQCGTWQFNTVSCVFAAYHTAWIAITFGLLVWYRKDALIIILGVFAGLMFNMTWVSWQYFFPWDMPSLCFFTWAILAYDRGRSILYLMAIICLGGLFKETTLCCSLLLLFGQYWPLKKRIVAFTITLLTYAIAKKALMAAYTVPVDFLSSGNFVSGLRLWHNLDVTFFHLGINHVVFANAGALLLIIVIPWKTRRDLLLKMVTATFCAGIWLFGNVIEFRVWYEILPLSWMITAEYLKKLQTEPIPALTSEATA